MAGKEMVPAKEFAVLQMESDVLQEVIAENLGDEQINEWDLDRIKMPSGGGIAFEVPTLEGVDSSKELIGVIVFAKTVRAYWPDEYSGGNDPPQCSSPDGVIGIGDPGVVCERCPFNAWDSDPNGPGKACKEMKQLFIVPKEDLLPIVLTLPPTSLAAQKRYFLKLASKGVPYSKVVTKITLQKERNEKAEYSSAVFALETRLDPESAEKISNYTDELRPSFERVPVVDVEAVEEAADEDA